MSLQFFPIHDGPTEGKLKASLHRNQDETVYVYFDSGYEIDNNHVQLQGQVTNLTLAAENEVYISLEGVFGWTYEGAYNTATRKGYLHGAS